MAKGRVAAFWMAFASLIVGTCFLIFPRKSSQVALEPHAPAQYDWRSSRRDLQAIGSIIQQYRATQHVLPPGRRRSAKDAGLPDQLGFFVLTSVPATYRQVKNAETFAQVGSNFLFIADSIPLSYNKHDGARLWSHRGESLPIIIDASMNGLNGWLKTPGRVPVLILRLNGRVDEVSVSAHNYEEILWKD